MQNVYENFRTSLALSLSDIVEDNDKLRAILERVDIAMGDYEISKKQMDLIPASGIPEDLLKCFLASKAIANLSQGTLKQYRYKLIHFFKTVSKPYTEITTNDIRLYLGKFKLERNASNSYMETVRITLNGFF